MSAPNNAGHTRRLRHTSPARGFVPSSRSARPMNICYPVRRTVYLELCFKFKQINGIENMYPLPSAAVIHYEEALYQVYGPLPLPLQT